MIYRIALHNVKNTADAEDIMQDVCIALLTRCPDTDDEERIKAWLIRVTVNKCNSLHRLLRHRKHDSIDEHTDIAAPAITEPIDEIRQLPLIDRNIIYLYYFESYTIAEIAEILGKNPNTISSRLQRARQKLKKLLKEGDDNDA